MVKQLDVDTNLCCLYVKTGRNIELCGTVAAQLWRSSTMPHSCVRIPSHRGRLQ